MSGRVVVKNIDESALEDIERVFRSMANDISLLRTNLENVNKQLELITGMSYQDEEVL